MWWHPLESRCNQQPFKRYFQFRFGDRHLESVVNNVGRHRRRHDQVGRGRKCGGMPMHLCTIPACSQWKVFLASFKMREAVKGGPKRTPWVDSRTN